MLPEERLERGPLTAPTAALPAAAAASAAVPPTAAKSERARA